jgi:Tfp pilus assembly protein PilN
MIKINLLPRDLKKEEGARYQIQFSIAGIIILIILLLVLYVSKMLTFVNLNKQMVQKNSDLEKVSALVAVVDQEKQQKAILDRKWGIIERLLQGRFKWAMLMDELSSCLPKSIWLTGLNSTRTEGGNVLSINGIAFDNFAIADFVTTLEDNQYFDNVELIAITEGGTTGKGNRSTLTFSITLSSKL